MGDETWEDVYYVQPRRARKELTVPDWVLDRQEAAKPETELEALMMAAPGDHETLMVDHNHGDTYKNLEAILGVDLDLDETEMEVLDATIVSGLSIRESAEILGIPATTVWRIKEGALDRIRRRSDV